MLKDKNENQIELKIRRRHGKVYLADGYPTIGSVYNLVDGGWVKMYFLNRTEFSIEILNRTRNEVTIPLRQKTYKLEGNEDMHEAVGTEQGNVGLDTITNEDLFHYSMEKTLSDY